jgi:hypothetical protein
MVGTITGNCYVIGEFSVPTKTNGLPVYFTLTMILIVIDGKIKNIDVGRNGFGTTNTDLV